MIPPNPGLEEVKQKRDLRDLDPYREILPGNRGNESLKQRGHLHGGALGQMPLGQMKDNPELRKRVLLIRPPPQPFL
jgi:hypothetical protein